jgi:hypothetical protein
MFQFNKKIILKTKAQPSISMIIWSMNMITKTTVETNLVNQKIGVIILEDLSQNIMIKLSIFKRRKSVKKPLKHF